MRMNLTFYWPILATAGVAALLAFTSATLSAQPPKGGGPPAGGGGGAASIFGAPKHEPGGPVQHLADGHPDIQGYWGVAESGGAVFELQKHPKPRPALPPGPGAIIDPPDGMIPYQPWAAAKAKDNLANHLADEPELHCLQSGIPKQMYVQFGLQILQPKNYVVMTWEFMHAIRMIPTDGRAHISPKIKLYEGDSVGHWEGDTLVVDTTNLNDRTWYDSVGNFHSDQEHVVERFTPVDTNTIKYEATVEDPKVLTRPFKIAMEFYRNAEPGYEQMEYACIEGNRDVTHYTQDEGGKAAKKK